MAQIQEKKFNVQGSRAESFNQSGILHFVVRVVELYLAIWELTILETSIYGLPMSSIKRRKKRQVPIRIPSKQ
jgi:hypothetical protein